MLLTKTLKKGRQLAGHTCHHEWTLRRLGPLGDSTGVAQLTTPLDTLSKASLVELLQQRGNCEGEARLMKTLPLIGVKKTSFVNLVLGLRLPFKSGSPVSKFQFRLKFQWE